MNNIHWLKSYYLIFNEKDIKQQLVRASRQHQKYPQ